MIKLLSRAKPSFVWGNLLIGLVMTWFISSCGSQPPASVVLVTTPSIGEPKVGAPSPQQPGEEIGISIEIASTGGVSLNYTWTADGGEIVRGQGSPAITYRVPEEPGTYNIRVKVEWEGQSIEKVTSIKVEGAISEATDVLPVETPEPSSADTPKPEPINTPKPTNTPTPIPIKLDLPADAGWINTGISLQTVQSMLISASGSIDLCTGCEGSGPITPDEVGELCYETQEESTSNQKFDIGCLLSKAPYGAIIGRIGNDIPFLISPSSRLTINSSGDLFLAINDCCNLTDNTGAYSIEIYLPPSAYILYPTPTLTPIPTIDADPTVYDNFNNPVNDGNYNKNLWGHWSDPPYQIVQQAGVLAISHNGKAEKGSALVSRKFTDFTPSEPIFFETKLMLDSNGQGKSHNVQMNLGVDFGNSKGWSSECGIDDGNAYCFDTPWPNQDGHWYNATGQSVGYDSWHTLRIELDPVTMTFTYYIDGQKVGSHIPVDAAQLKKSKFSFNIGVWSSSTEIYTGYIDDVRIGPTGQ